MNCKILREEINFKEFFLAINFMRVNKIQYPG